MDRLPHEMPGIPGVLYRPLDDYGVKAIADSAFRILEESGIDVYSETSFEAFKKCGAICDASSRRVKIPRGLMEDFIASTPSDITLYSRCGNFDCNLTGSKVHYGTGGTAIYVLDPDTGLRRPSTVNDVALNARMVDQLENVHLFTINVFPNEIENKDHIDVNRFFHAFDNMTKHVMGGIYSMKGLKDVVAMAEKIAGSPEALRERPFCSFITLVISPYKLDDIYGEFTCYLAKKGIPVVVPTEPITGTTSPITLAGNVLTHISETLAGVAQVQAVAKGAPCICGSVGSITNLTNMDHVAGGVERGMISAAVSQMAQHFKIPFYGTAGTSDSKEVDVQAAYESALSAQIVAMSGANYIHDIAGLMETDMSVGYEKLVVDNEILGMIQRVRRGIEVNEDTLATDLIIEVGPGGDFLTEEHTMEYMREEFFFPKISNRDKRVVYNPEESAINRAKRFVRKVREEEAVSKIDAKLREEILKSHPEILPITWK